MASALNIQREQGYNASPVKEDVMRNRLVMFAGFCLIGLCYVLSSLPKKRVATPTGLLRYPPRSNTYLT